MIRLMITQLKRQLLADLPTNTCLCPLKSDLNWVVQEVACFYTQTSVTHFIHSYVQEIPLHTNLTMNIKVSDGIIMFLQDNGALDQT